MTASRSQNPSAASRSQNASTPQAGRAATLLVLTLGALALVVATGRGDLAQAEEPTGSVGATAATAAPEVSDAASAPGGSPAHVEFFETKIRPLLAAHCLECHGPEKQKGNLRLDARVSIVEGGDSGSELTPGKPAESRLVTAVGYQDPDLQMPPKGKLSDAEIRDVARWVEIGAPWGPDAGGHGAAPAAGAKKEAFDLAARRARHWAWQPIAPREIPTVKHESWPQQPLDAFVLARLEAAGLQPAPQADRRALARRASFDLLGLPPEPYEVEAFVSDPSPEAWPRLIDRLMASPHFGERWARHWLDLVRFAETRGHEFDYAAPLAYQYRDYVIRAFNADLPYNQFVVEQIAGDLVDPPRMAGDERNESVIGAGFWSLGEWMHSPVDIRQDELDRIDNQIDVFGKTFLGMTIACARCHDHKFDAISAADYYSLAGYLHSSSYCEAPFEHQRHNRGVAEKLRELERTTAERLVHDFSATAAPVVARGAEYLLAARDVANDPRERAASQEELAHQRGLDAPLLELWVNELTGPARQEKTHPLHGWALGLADGSGEGATKNVPSLAAFGERVRSWLAAAREPDSAGDVEWIVDYRRLQSGQWIVNGLAFGSEPRPRGAWRLGANADRPLDGPLFAPAADTAGLGARLPSMLRTPTFVISQPRVWSLIRGSAEALLVIDSHRMLAGPLHGQTRQTIDAPEWSWRSHNVQAYQGQRAHLEFRSIEPARDMAVMCCVQAEALPAAVAGKSPQRNFASLAAALDQPEAFSPETLADLYQRALTNAWRALVDREAPLREKAWRENASSRSQESPASESPASESKAKLPADAEWSSLSRWMVERPELFGVGPRERQIVQQTLEEHAAAKAALVAQLKPSGAAMSLLDATAFDERVLLRGSPKTPGPPAPRRFLEALGGLEHPAPAAGSGRLELARQLVDPANPLTARVMVNRVWHHLLGRGIVPSVDNLGVLGEAPSHPELLDYLADVWIRDGWSLKRLIRQIMLSSTYQLSSRGGEALAAADPPNALFGRARIRRLEGEAIRDAMLAISGGLKPAVGGPSVEVYVPPFVNGRGKPKASGPLDGDGRRSIYTLVRRNFLPPMMLAFDMPIPFNTMGRRSVSNVPAQALIMLNDPLVIDLAKRWAARSGDPAGRGAPERAAPERIREMYLAAFAREPQEDELRFALAFLERDAELRDTPPEKRLDDPEAWANLAHMLLNTKEFIYLN